MVIRFLFQQSRAFLVQCNSHFGQKYTYPSLVIIVENPRLGLKDRVWFVSNYLFYIIFYYHDNGHSKTRRRTHWEGVNWGVENAG